MLGTSRDLSTQLQLASFLICLCPLNPLIILNSAVEWKLLQDKIQPLYFKDLQVQP